MPLPLNAVLIRSEARRGRFKAAMFDFDGTVSLIREGWAGIMADMGLEIFREQKLIWEMEPILRIYLEDQMLRLSGKPSIFQMRKLADEVQARGGTPPDPEELLAEFLRRLLAVSGRRCDDLATGRATPNDWAVAGTFTMLDMLQARDVALYLASGTDLKFVRTEAELLKLTSYFGEHIYGPADNSPNFSKHNVVEKILKERGIAGKELLGFGDGYAETVAVKGVGGLAVGVASSEPGVPGMNRLKRDMLVGLGADVIVPDYREPDQLLGWLFGEE